MSLFNELKRRNVFRVGAAYIVLAWLVMQVTDVILNNVAAPGWVFHVILLLLGIGFLFAMFFAWAFELTPEGLKREQEVDREKSITPHTGRKLDYVIIGLLALTVVFLVVDNYVLQDETVEQVTASGPARDQGRQSIAVLPFVNMSADVENEYFSDGIAEEMLNLLVKLPELKVSSRTSSFAFKGKDIDIPTIAERLGVTNILEGSVRRAGNRIRITAQLIDTESDSHLWSEIYDRELEDIFAVQDEIAHSIVEALKVTLAPGEERALESIRATSVEAYDYYLRGRAYFLRTTGDDTRKANEMFARAIEIDPTYAPAYAWLANSHTQLFRFYESFPEHLSEADVLSRKALELAPDLADAHIALGFVLTMKEQYQEAEQAFEAALRLNPRSGDAYFYYGIAAYHQGNDQRTAELWERTVEFDPDHLVWGLLPQVYRSLGRDEDVMGALRRYGFLMRRILETNPDDIQSLVGLASSDLGLGKKELAVEAADRLVPLASGDSSVLYNVACLYSQAGEIDKAIIALEKSHEAGLADPAWMEQDSDLDAVRDDPRYKELVMRMKAGLSDTE